MKKVDAKIPVNSLGEIFQHNRTEFAVCRYDEKLDRVVMCHQFVHCRDFLGDVFVGVEENKDMGIYGFQYRKDNPRPSTTNTELLLRLEDGSLSTLQKNFPILREIEKEIGFETSIAEQVDVPSEKKSIVWVVGDPRWQRTALSYSLYTFLLKCMTYKIKDSKYWLEEIKKAHTTESTYADPEYLRWLFNELPYLIDMYPSYSGFKNQKDIPISTIHNNTGFHSLKSLLWDKTQNLYYQNSHASHVLFDYKKAA